MRLVNDTIAADAVLMLHAAYVAFVVLTLPLVFVGAALGWRWVRNRTVRWLHLAAIGIVVVQSWLGIACPLTLWEAALRGPAHGTIDDLGFVAHWLQALLFWSAPGWVFTSVYTAFGLLVALSWIVVPPAASGAVRAPPRPIFPKAAEVTDRPLPIAEPRARAIALEIHSTAAGPPESAPARIDRPVCGPAPSRDAGRRKP